MDLPIEFLQDVIEIKDESKARTPGNIMNISINVKDYKLVKSLFKEYKIDDLI